MAQGFPTLEDARAAMIEIARLRNDWAVMVAGDFSAECRDKCVEIAERFGGHVARARDKQPRAPTFNGYRPDL